MPIPPPNRAITGGRYIYNTLESSVQLAIKIHLHVITSLFMDFSFYIGGLVHNDMWKATNHWKTT